MKLDRFWRRRIWGCVVSRSRRCFKCDESELMSIFMQRQHQRKKKVTFVCGRRSRRRKRMKDRSQRKIQSDLLVCETICRSKMIYVETRVIFWCEIMMKRLVSNVTLFTRKRRSIETKARPSYKSEEESIQRKENVSYGLQSFNL